MNTLQSDLQNEKLFWLYDQKSRPFFKLYKFMFTYVVTIRNNKIFFEYKKL